MKRNASEFVSSARTNHEHTHSIKWLRQAGVSFFVFAFVALCLVLCGLKSSAACDEHEVSLIIVGRGGNQNITERRVPFYSLREIGYTSSKEIEFISFNDSIVSHHARVSDGRALRDAYKCSNARRGDNSAARFWPQPIAAYVFRNINISQVNSFRAYALDRAIMDSYVDFCSRLPPTISNIDDKRECFVLFGMSGENSPVTVSHARC